MISLSDMMAQVVSCLELPLKKKGLDCNMKNFEVEA